MFRPSLLSYSLVAVKSLYTGFFSVCHISVQEVFEDTKGVIIFSYIEEQTIQWPQEKSTKGQTTIYKTYT